MLAGADFNELRKTNYIELFGEEESDADDDNLMHNLNRCIQLGDVVEYRLNTTRMSIPRKGRIVSIGALSSDKIVQLSDGTWLYKSKHVVKRVEIVRSDNIRRVRNPDPCWVSLDKMAIIQPFDDVVSDEEDSNNDDDVEFIDEGDITEMFASSPVEDPNISSTAKGRKHANARSRPTSSTATGSCMAEEVEEDNDEGEQNAQNTDRSNKDARLRTACGITGRTFFKKTRRIKKLEEYLDKRRQTQTYLKWAALDDRKYDAAKRNVNDLYKECLAYGIVEEFYKSKIYQQNTESDFKKSWKKLYNKINYLAIKKKTKLDINLDVKFMDNPGFNRMGRSRQTNRERRVLEKIIHFEYRMRTLQLKTCTVCRENKLAFEDKDIVRDVNENREGGGAGMSEGWTCDVCRKNKNTVEDQLKQNLQPVWYERNEDGSYKMTGEGENQKRIPRYDIPDELKDLSMAEKLLIRRCSPLIPSVHIRHGIYGLNGHCVCFPQNIDNMCSELPQTKSNMVIFVRNIRNRGTNNSMRQKDHFRVRKTKVIKALEWLKIHHIGYHDITIKKSNLDWIQNDSVYNETTNCNLEMNCRNQSTQTPGKETLSENQCPTNNANQADEMEIEAMHYNYNTNNPNAKSTRIMQGLMQHTKQKKDVLEFPHIDHNKPLE